MITLTGQLRSTATLGGTTNKKTGEVYPLRQVLQVEGLDHRGLVQLYTLTVPDIDPFKGRIGEQITLPVRPYARDGVVNFLYEGKS